MARFLKICEPLHCTIQCGNLQRLQRFIYLSRNYLLVCQKAGTFRKVFFHNKHKTCKMILATGFRIWTWWFWTLQTIPTNVYIHNTWSYFTARPLQGRLYVHTVPWFKVKWSERILQLVAGGRLLSNFRELQSYSLFITHPDSFGQCT